MHCNQARNSLCLLVLIKCLTHVEAPLKNLLHASRKSQAQYLLHPVSEDPEAQLHTEAAFSSAPQVKALPRPMEAMFSCFHHQLVFKCWLFTLAFPQLGSLIQLYHLPGPCPYIASSLCFSYLGLSISRLENLPS